MKENIYANIINEAPFAYALHEIVWDENGKAVDYIFREVNAAFESMTGLNAKKIVNKRISKVLPETLNDDFNWIEFYGNIVKNNETKEFDQYALAMRKWYRIFAKAIDKTHFTTIFTNVSNEYLMAKAAEELSLFNDESIDYMKMSAYMMALSGASYVAVNVFENDGRGFTTVALTGVQKNIEKAFSILGDKIIEKKWPFDPMRHGKIKDQKTTVFKSLFDLASNIIPKSIITLLQKTFNIGEAVVIKTSKDNITVGDFTLIFEQHKHLENIHIVETFADLCGSIILRVLNEQLIKANEEKYRTILETALDGFFVADTNGHIHDVNTAICKMLGYTKEELSTLTIADIEARETSEEIAEHIKYIKRIGAERFETLLKTKTGKTIDADISLKYIKTNEDEKLVVFARDITKKKHAETGLKLSEEKFSKAFNSSPSIIGLSDLETGKFVEVNQTFYDVLEYSHVETIGKEIEDLVRMDSGFRDKALKLLKETGSIRNLETILYSKTGKPIHVQLSADLINIGNKTYNFTTAVDITHRKHAEEALKLANQQALAASAAKSQFLANMSHEIRTPLNGVIGFTELLSNTPLDALQKQYVDNTIVSANALLGIINDVLDYSKIEAGKLELDIIKTDIVNLMEQASDILKIHAARKGIELILNIHPDLPRYAYVDSVRLKQILVNLLNNAVKFTEKGEVELKISFKNNNNTKGTFHISVRDTGIGIHEKYSEEIFKAFTQADTSTTRKYGGTGLGLTISNLLALKMGSNLSFVTQEGKGSTFSFELKTKYLVGRKQKHEQIKNLKNVLVVDDNDRNRLILEHAFNNWRLEFTGVNSAYKALKIIENTKQFDLMIVDYHMPKMDGFSFIKRLKEKFNDTFSEQAIIFLHSSYDDVSVLEECEKLGVCLALTKPIKLRELYDYLKNIKTRKKFLKKTEKKTLINDSFKPQSEEVYHILLVEDNFVNMILLSSMLQTVLPNARIYEAYNGLEALDVVKRQKLNLVFMDVQMPVMGGIDAAKEIRKSCDTKIRSLPIVALTAGATQNEKDNCFAAGMNEFITKPINKDMLFKVLDEFLNYKHSAEKEKRAKTTTSDTLMHFDIEDLKYNLNNDEVLIKRLLKTTLTDYPKYMNKIFKAVKANNENEVREYAHGLKGSALSVGFVRLGTLAKDIERHTNDTVKLHKLIAEINEEWQIVKDIVDKYLSSQK